MARTTRGPRSVQLLCAAHCATAAGLLARHGMEPNFPTPITALHLSAAVVKDRSLVKEVKTVKNGMGIDGNTRNCPNGATATVAMLIPCWLIYPWTSSPLWKAGPRLTLGLAAAFWLLVTFLRGELDNPITSLASFGLGVAAARVAQEVFPDLEVDQTEDVNILNSLNIRKALRVGIQLLFLSWSAPCIAATAVQSHALFLLLLV
eukprot:s1619_g10.t1